MPEEPIEGATAAPPFGEAADGDPRIVHKQRATVALTSGNALERLSQEGPHLLKIDMSEAVSYTHLTLPTSDLV